MPLCCYPSDMMSMIFVVDTADNYQQAAAEQSASERTNKSTITTDLPPNVAQMSAVEDILAIGVIAKDNYVICTTIVRIESMSFMSSPPKHVCCVVALVSLHTYLLLFVLIRV